MMTAHDQTFDRLQKTLGAFQRVTHGAASLQMLVTFLDVAREEGRTQVEIAKAVMLPESTSSRQLIDLGPFNRHKEPGFGLVKGDIDPMDLRVKRYVLTPKGKALAKVLQGLLDGTRPSEVEAEMKALEQQ
jgi:DNA-binding MarR family transcriptional regulator